MAVADPREELLESYRAAIKAFRVLVDDNTLDAIASHGGIEAAAVRTVKAALAGVDMIEEAVARG